MSQSSTVATPLPIKQISILLCARFGEPVVYTVLLPFVYFMVRDFHEVPEPRRVALEMGWVASAFSFAQMFSGIPWGTLSDRVGRRPIILSGLFFTTLTILLFGLSHSLAWAITTRAMCGLLNGNVSIVKSAMAELTDDSNQARGFSFLPMIWALGSIVGPLLGGFLSYPATTIGGPFNSPFWHAYPFFLPCLAAASISFTGFIITLFFFKETLRRPEPLSLDEALVISPDEMSPLLSSAVEAAPLTRRESFARSISSILPPACRPSAALLMALSLLSVVSEEFYPLWAAAPHPVGGLGFNVIDIGLSMSVSGVTVLIVQVAFFPGLERRFNKISLFRFAMLAFALLWLVLPFVSTLVHTPFLWPLLLTLLGAQAGIGGIASASASLIIVSAARKIGALGRVNGSTLCAVSLVRASAPTIGGLVWGHAIESGLPYPLPSALSWWLLSAGALLIYRLATAWQQRL